jgi:two-component system sensor histidine kinase/response regulator
MTVGTTADGISPTHLAHELRTPLTHIIGYSGLLLEDAAGDPVTIACLARISHEAGTIQTQIHDRLAPAAEGTAAFRIASLRKEISAPLGVIIHEVAALAARYEGMMLLDVMRMARACTALLTFVQQNNAQLPTRPAAGARAEVIGAANDVRERSSQVLVVDDNPGNLDMLGRQLDRHGYSVVSSASGPEALGLLESGRFDLVLLDVIMPGMSGPDVLRKMKATSALAAVPVIMISALDEVETAASCIEMGAEDYLVRPVDPVLLHARIHSALERKRLQAEQLARTRELEATTRALARANEDLQAFAFVASHDLQEPLRTITTMLELFCLNSGVELTEEQRNLSRMALNGAARMRRLISGLLAYSLAEGGEERPQPVACEAALAEALGNLTEAIRECGAAISFDALPTVLVDYGRLVQLFQNLISNAIKYRSEAPLEIRIHAHGERGEWTISVSDNGIGIDEPYLKRVFQPFNRLHGHELAGTGLGLAISERIVRRWGGNIWAESQVGIGSAFHFTARGATAED